MIRCSRRGTRFCAIIGTGVFAVAALSGCQNGKNTQTSLAYSPVDGRNYNVPSSAPAHRQPYIAIRNAVIVSSSADPSHAGLAMTIVNDTSSDDSVTKVTVGGILATISGTTSLSFHAHQYLPIGAAGSPAITVVGLKERPGDWVPVVVSFGNAGDVSMSLLVQGAEGDYANVVTEGSTSPTAP